MNVTKSQKWVHDVTRSLLRDDQKILSKKQKSLCRNNELMTSLNKS